MSTSHADTDSETVEAVFDTPSRKGWEFFTKFLLWNVIAIIASLLIIGLLTVWR